MIEIAVRQPCFLTALIWPCRRRSLLAIPIGLRLSRLSDARWSPRSRRSCLASLHSAGSGPNLSIVYSTFPLADRLSFKYIRHFVRRLATPRKLQNLRASSRSMYQINTTYVQCCDSRLKCVRSTNYGQCDGKPSIDTLFTAHGNNRSLISEYCHAYSTMLNN